MSERRTTMYCQRYAAQDGQEYYTHFQTDPRVTALYDEDEPVFKAEVVETTADTPGCYWAWWDNEDNEFQFTAYKRFLVDMCFAYGSKVEEEHGRGHLIPVTLTFDNAWRFERSER